MGFYPPVKSRDDAAERPAEFGQLVIDAGRHLSVAGAPDKAVLFEPPQRLDQHLSETPVTRRRSSLVRRVPSLSA